MVELSGVNRTRRPIEQGHGWLAAPEAAEFRRARCLQLVR
jgi:hypothetical protein